MKLLLFLYACSSETWNVCVIFVLLCWWRPVCYRLCDRLWHTVSLTVFDCVIDCDTCVCLQDLCLNYCCSPCQTIAHCDRLTHRVSGRDVHALPVLSVMSWQRLHANNYWALYRKSCCRKRHVISVQISLTNERDWMLHCNVNVSINPNSGSAPAVKKCLYFFELAKYSVEFPVCTSTGRLINSV